MPNKYIKYNKYRHKKSEWITEGIIRSIKYRDKLYKSLKLLHPDSADYETIKHNLQVYNAILNKSIRRAKKFYYSSQLNLAKKDPKKTWDVLNNILNRNTNVSQSNLFNIDGVSISNKKEIANYFNSYFTEIGSKSAPLIAPGRQNDFKTFLTRTINTKFNFSNVLEAEIQEIIENMPKKNSCGFDYLSSSLLKKLSPLLIKSITLIVNQSLNTGVFPDHLKKAKVIPVFKKDDKTLLKNYRPISLLPIISKILEKIVYSQLSHYFIKNQLFNPYQYGFRTNHSTEHAVLEITDRIISSMDQGDTPVAIFLDLSKAFDTLNHKVLVDKLAYYGIQDTSLAWFTSYLSNRVQFTVFENHISDDLIIDTGVPQGSVLGPLLFNIYTNDISNISNYFHIIQYADDTALICSQKLALDSRHISAELSYIHDWLTVNRLSLNILKTKFMVFSVKNKKVTFPHILLNDTAIENVSSFDFLGVIIHEKMNWEHHVNKIANKINRYIGLMNKLKNILPVATLKTLYDSLILPHLNYGNLAWGLSAGRLIQLQKRAVRVMSGSKYNAHTEPIFKSYNTLKFEDIYKLNALKFYYKYSHKELPSYFQEFCLERGSDVHTYNTRYRNQMKKTKTKHIFADRCIRSHLPVLINATNLNIISKINTHSLTGFCNYIKISLLQDYVMECNITNCYVCSQ